MEHNSNQNCVCQKDTCPDDTDVTAMHVALAEAEKGRFATAPNPCVGAVLLLDGKIVGKAFHAKAGQLHAERKCIEEAQKQGVALAETTLVVTLEPCRHYGKTPPCVQAILDAGIKKVVIGALDPNPKAGGGAQILRNHGVTVISRVLEQECLDCIADFLVWQQTTRPYVITKLASTLDGYIATRTGHSQWITGADARKRVHEIRSAIGAIGGAVFVGGKTFLKDNPQLTSREGVVEKQPLAVLVTSTLPDETHYDTYYLLQKRAEETVFFTSHAEKNSTKAKLLESLGIHVVGLDYVQADSVAPETSCETFCSCETFHETSCETICSETGSKMLSMEKGFSYLREQLGCWYVLCEGGGTLALQLIEQHLMDELHLHFAPKILADEKSQSLFSGRVIQSMDQAEQLRLQKVEHLGTDVNLIYRLV